MSAIRYMVNNQKEQYTFKVQDHNLTIKKFLQLVSSKHKKDFKFLLLNSSIIDEEDCLSKYLKSGDNDIFIVSEDCSVKVSEKSNSTKKSQESKTTHSTNSTCKIQMSNTIPDEYSISFQKNINIDNFKISKLVRDDFLLTKVYQIIDKNNPKKKYFAEFIEKDNTLDSDIIDDSYLKCFNFQVSKNLCNHGAISNYIGIGLDLSDDSPCIVLLSKFYPNGKLSDFLDLPNKEKKLPFTVNTYLQIILYGIASGMSLLSEKHIQHSILLKSNVRLNEFLFPKICFYAAERTNVFRDPSNMFRGNYNETILDQTSDVIMKDVLLYSLIMYEIVTKKKPFIKLTSKFVADFINGHRPHFGKNVSHELKKLVKSCWSTDVSKRPSFKEIAENLKKQECLLEDVDKDAYYEYVRLIDEYQSEVKKNKVNYSFEYFVSLKSGKFKPLSIKSLKVDGNFDDDDDEIKTLNSLNVDYLDLSKFNKIKKIGEGLYGKVFVVESKETGELYAAKVSKRKIFKRDEKNTNIYREARFISQLNHPCILRFIGYSPLDFDDNKKPVILTEYNSNGSLQSLLDLERRGVEIDEFDDTKKLMIIYGIASCMSFLHRKGMIHRDLKPDNFLLDKYLLPKLANFCYTKDTNKEDLVEEGNELIGLPKYFAPEIFEKEEYSKSSDVYAFSLILYEIVSGKSPFSGQTIYQIMTEVMNGDRPSLDESVPECYRHLIEACWSQDPSKRPSFDQIIQELETNKEFLQFDDDETKAFQLYIKYINEYVTKFEKNHEILQIEKYFSSINKTFEKVDLVSIRKEYYKDRKLDFPINQLTCYTRLSKIGEGSFGVIYKVLQYGNIDFLAAKVSKKQLYEMDDDEFENLHREIEIISSLKNSCILKFDGFSPVNFEKEEYPVVVTELAPKGSLRDILNKEKMGFADEKWDNTAKLINIYGIAFGMSYLHHKNIIHRDLKPDNILQSDHLHPKIADFGLSKKLSNAEQKEQISAYKLKGTPLYCAPEILIGSNYTKAGDVYAFGFIVYEIMTNEIPFTNINMFALLKKIIEKERPKFNSPIPSCYRDLIEKCWSQNPEDRPSFEGILDLLEVNRDFILDDVDEGAFYDYVDNVNKHSIFRKAKIDETDQTCNSNNRSKTRHKKKADKLESKSEKIIEDTNKSKKKSHKTKNEQQKIEEEDEKIDVLISGRFEYYEKKRYNIPASVRIIEDGVFKNSQLVSIVIPETVESIGCDVFQNCSHLKSVKLPNSITILRAGLFNKCSSLEEITIPSSVTKIEDRVFYNCSKLHEIIIPSSVTEIGDEVFYGCKFVKFSIPSNLAVIGKGCFLECDLMEEIEILSSLPSIANSTFKRCKSLKQIKIPSSVEVIDDLAFCGCTSLESIVIPESVTAIKNNAFEDCSSLTEITIPPSVKSIGSSAFYKCTSLLNITIPSSVTSILGMVFSRCSSLKSVEIQPDSPITVIKCHAFNMCASLKKVCISSSVDTIEEKAFEGCTSLVEITIPSSVTKIEHSVFKDCTSLKRVKLPSSLNSIGYNLFYGCKSLHDVEIPSSLKIIEVGVFRNCSALEDVSIPSSIIEIKDYAFSGCTSIKKISVPSTTKIGKSSFQPETAIEII